MSQLITLISLKDRPRRFSKRRWDEGSPMGHEGSTLYFFAFFPTIPKIGQNIVQIKKEKKKKCIFHLCPAPTSTPAPSPPPTHIPTITTNPGHLSQITPPFTFAFCH